MITLFMPWLQGWWPRLCHILRGHQLADAGPDGPGTTWVLCSCGTEWVEDDRL